jgi:hypothetical protein
MRGDAWRNYQAMVWAIIDRVTKPDTYTCRAHHGETNNLLPERRPKGNDRQASADVFSTLSEMSVKTVPFFF